MSIWALTIQLGLKTLHRLAHSQSRLLNRLALLSVELAPVSDVTRYRLHEYILTGAPMPRTSPSGHRFPQWVRLFLGEVRAWLAWARFRDSAHGYRIRPTFGAPINWWDLRQRQRVDIDAVQSAAERLRDAPVINVLCDIAADISETLLNPAFKNSRFVIYSFEDRKKDMEALGLQDRATIVGLRDRFPDISPEAETLQDFARSLSQAAMGPLLADLCHFTADSLRRQLDVAAQGLEDDIAHQLILSECYRWAARSIPADQPLLFVAGSTRLFPAVLSKIEAEISAYRLFVAYAQFNERQFWLECIHTVTSTPADPSKAEIPAWDASAYEAIFFRKAKRAAKSASFAADCTKLPSGNERPLLLLFAPVSPAYRETVNELIDDLVIHRGRRCIAVSTTFTPVKLRLSPAASSRLAVTHTSYPPSVRTGLPTRRGGQALSRQFLHRLGERTIFEGHDVSPLLIPVFREFLFERLFVMIAVRSYVQRLVERAKVGAMLVTPGRHWLVRAATAAVQENGLATTVDVQALNVLARSKYRPPIAELATVIDSGSAAIYNESLGFPRQRIRVTGTPCNDVLLRKVEAVDRDNVCRSIGLGPSCHKRILLASQLQPFERMEKIAAALADIVAGSDDIELIVKLHPREGDARLQAYRDVFARKGLAESRVALVRDLTPAEAIAVSDVVVTIYSNMAREAAISGREVVLALFVGWSPPLRLDLEGLAFGPSTQEEFRRTVLECLDRCAAGGGEIHASSRYFMENPHLLEANALERIYTTVLEAEALYDDAPKLLPPGSTESAKVSDTQIGPITVVAESTEDLYVLSDLIRSSTELRVYCPRLPSGPINQSALFTFETGEYSFETKSAIDQAAQRANMLAERLCDIITAQLRKSRFGARLEKLRPALWLRLRPAIVDAARYFANYQIALTRPAVAVIVIGRSEEFILDCLARVKPNCFDVLLAVDIEANAEHHTLFRLKPEEPLPAGFAAAYLGKNVRRIDLLDTRTDLVTAYGSLSPAAITKTVREVGPFTLSRFDQWLDDLEDKVFGLPQAQTIVLTTAWHLKTVPPTMKPVLDLLGDRFSILGFNFANESQPALAAAVSDEGRKKSVILSPSRVSAFLPPLPSGAIKQAVVLITGNMLKDAIIRAEPHLIRKALQKAVQGAVSEAVWQAVGWDEICKQAFAKGATVSLACPGRQWHSEIAHIRAAEAGARSITVQNAYMAAGYTYTKPTGDIVTAIDTWSRDLFIKDFSVPPEHIVVTSTPRFDYLSGLSAGDPEGIRRSLGIDSQQPLVCFAAQQGLDEETKTLVRAFAGIDTKVPICFCIKLHPRSADSLVTEIENLLAGQESRHEFRIMHSEPIEQLLTASDVVVTIYSNVGMEAAVLGKPLLIAKLDAADLPLPLDQLGVGLVACSDAEVQDGIRRLLEDPETREAVRRAQRAYLDQNIHLRDGDSSETIASLVASQAS